MQNLNKQWTDTSLLAVLFACKHMGFKICSYMVLFLYLKLSSGLPQPSSVEGSFPRVRRLLAASRAPLAQGSPPSGVHPTPLSRFTTPREHAGAADKTSHGPRKNSKHVMCTCTHVATAGGTVNNVVLSCLSLSFCPFPPDPPHPLSCQSPCEHREERGCCCLCPLETPTLKKLPLHCFREFWLEFGFCMSTHNKYQDVQLQNTYEGPPRKYRMMPTKVCFSYEARHVNTL